jgi:hypothetical protein
VSGFLDDLDIELPAQWEPFVNWLSKKRKAFKLFGLPLKLRSMIYEQITGLYIWPHFERTYCLRRLPVRQLKALISDRISSTVTIGSRWQERPSTPSILQVTEHPKPRTYSKQVRAKFRKATMSSAILHSQDHQTLEDLIPGLQMQMAPPYFPRFSQLL